MNINIYQDKFPYMSQIWGATVYSEYPISEESFQDKEFKIALIEAKVQVDKYGVDRPFITEEFLLYRDGTIIARPGAEFLAEFEALTGTSGGSFKYNGSLVNG